MAVKPGNRVDEAMAVSLITTCKGRRHHLERSLAAMLSQAFHQPYEVVVVDYGCPRGTFGWCQQLNLKRLTAVRALDDVAFFNRSRAKNLGATAARGRILAFIDADILPDPSWLASAVEPIARDERDLMRVHQHRGGWDRWGSCAMSRTLYDQLRGYDEAMQDWGAEDLDLYHRAAMKARVGWFHPYLLHPIRHSHDERTRYHRCRDIDATIARNGRQARQRGHLVNPAGYGRGRLELWRGERDQAADLPPAHPPARRVRPRIRRSA